MISLSGGAMELRATRGDSGDSMKQKGWRRYRKFNITRCHRKLGSLLSLKIGSKLSTMLSASDDGDFKLSLIDEKKQIREEVNKRLQKLKFQHIDNESRRTNSILIDTPFLKAANNIGVYISSERLMELNTSWVISEILNQGKNCYVPKVLDRNSNMDLYKINSPKDLVVTPPFGIMEPSADFLKSNPDTSALESEEYLDLLLVPGVAFDLNGFRVGRGGGYYDKFIARCREKAEISRVKAPVLVGLALRCQIFSKVPVNDKDARMDWIITATEAIDCRGSAALTETKT